MINLKRCEETLSAKQFYWEDELINNILYRISQLKFIIYWELNFEDSACPSKSHMLNEYIIPFLRCFIN